MFKSFYIVLFLLPFQVFAQDLKVSALKCEYKNNPLGIESAVPHLSWISESTGRNVKQTAYHILVADDAALLNKNAGNVWDSKKVSSVASIQIAYHGKPLQSNKTYYWKLKVWDNQNHVTAWSTPAKWQMGLLTPADWKNARWIAYDKLPDTSRIVPLLHGRGPKKLGLANDVLPLLRKDFKVNKPVKKATLYICGLGHFELSMNGNKVGDHFLDPGWTNYDKQALYVPFDVTAHLKQGSNTIGVTLGNGFYYIPRDKRYRKLTGAYGYPKMICRLVTEYKDGSVDNVVSDASWKTAPGPITFTSIYGGEDYNANIEQDGWNKPGFDDTKWKSAMLVDGSPQLNAQLAEPLKIFESFSPQKITQVAPGKWVFDLGQNASGIPQITVKGKKGDTVKIYPAELINADGSANQKGSGGPYYFAYVLKGGGAETWQPRFTYYGFRYVQLEGGVPQGKDNPQNSPLIIGVKGLHTRNAAPVIGSFACSNELFNKTYTLIDWAVKSNMASVFTDCPHREKLGWLEEAHLVGSSIHYSYDIANLSRKCISDMRVAQTAEGLVPEIAPEFTQFGEPFRDSPEWGSNAVIYPWYIYQWYGDKQLLVDSYSMMQRYLDYLAGKADNHILDQGLGDWYDIGPKPPGLSQNTPKGITATAIYYYDLNIAAKVATVLGKPDDATQYHKQAQQVKQAFNAAFFNMATKQYGTGSQTANAMALYAGLVELQYKAAVLVNLVQDIRNRNNSLTAGDIGYRYLLRVLDDEGRSDVIFDMNNRSDVPGYGYQLAKGATALTESWQALGGVSNNHFMLGHIMEWFFSGLAGIRPAPDAVAYNRVEIRPEPVGDVTHAEATTQTPYGTLSTKWKIQDDSSFDLDVQIPVGTMATVYLPVSQSAKIKEANKPLSLAKSIKYLGYKNGKALIQVGSGYYHFSAQQL
ncbi:family 78 glycoside hydrolase catalytic domain [Mucilaginibacter sp. Bleaf8]|uniref:family 78 glycoside hydrolase catalytic domain n=1 Tax=Mucilaginibacter sp. Bleaf8 TaxID=2834430 RepID=UPI001BCC0B12|nr:family 78 glycoside hydrolase catalytic domain [Mucilaginibacter sp. Bleaf8]MBS7564888.1 family 78 glycoside hydrolase catalytic domain [Mucilaginibacter sp. Bleaf8]